MASFSPSSSDIIISLSPQRCRLTASFSMPDINRLGLGHTFGSIWSPNLLSGSLLEHAQAHHPKISAAFNALRVQFSHLKHRIYVMETENNELRHANMVLCSDSQALERELSNFRADYYAERFQSKIRIQSARADKDRITILSDKLEQAEKFIMAMVDIKLHEPVLRRAAEAVKQGADTEEALIDAVRAAATKKGSTWSRIIPAIVGPRSPEHYLSAIKLALMLQKDLHEREKVSNFWKTIAKSNPANVDTMTPSSSFLSEVGGQDVEHSISQQAVLDDMIALLTNGDTLPRKSQSTQPPVAYSTEVVDSELLVTEDKPLECAVASISTAEPSTIQAELDLYAKLASPVSSLPLAKEHSTQATPLIKAPKTVKVSVGSPPTKVSQIPVSPLRSKVKASQNAQAKLPSPVSPSKLRSISPTKQVSPSRISSKQATTPVRKAPVMPIRSRLSTPRTNTFKRPVLTSIDLNRPLAKTNISNIVTKRTIPGNISDDTIKEKPSKDHSKNLVKRRGVIMEEIGHPPPSIVTENENIVLPMTAEIEIYEPSAPLLPSRVAEITHPTSSSISTENPMHIPPIRPADKESPLPSIKFDLSPENIQHGSLLAAQALQSLERICAAFSSDSLGSLEMTDEGSYYVDDLESDSEDPLFTNERNSNMVPSASLTNLSHICQVAHGNSLDEDTAASGPPRPSTSVAKCSTWASSTPRRHISSGSAASSSSSSSESISILASVLSKKSSKPNGFISPSRTPIPSSAYPTDGLAKSLKDTFYKAVPPPQNLSPFPIKQNVSHGCQRPLPPSQSKPSQSRKARSNSISIVSPLPPTLSTPIPDTLLSPFKQRSNTINAVSPVSPTRHSPKPECPTSLTKPRSNTTLPVSRSHVEKTNLSSAKRRSNTLDSYLQVPSKNAQKARTKTISSGNDTTIPTAAFMRRPGVKASPIQTRRMTNSVAPLIPTWSPASDNGILSPTQYRNMLRGGVSTTFR